MHMAMEQATADHVKSGLTVARVRKPWASGRGGTGICALLCDVARCLRGRKNLSDVDVHVSEVDGTELAQSQSCATGSISGSISDSPAISQYSPKAHRIVTADARLARASPTISQHSPKAHRIVTVDARLARANPTISQYSPAISPSDVTQSVA
jgi:hypothetical protein